MSGILNTRFLKNEAAIFNTAEMFRPTLDEQREHLPKILRQIGHLLIPVTENTYNFVALLGVQQRDKTKTNVQQLTLYGTPENSCEVVDLNVSNGAAQLGVSLLNMGSVTLATGGDTLEGQTLARIEHIPGEEHLIISGVTEAGVLIASQFSFEVMAI